MSHYSHHCLISKPFKGLTPTLDKISSHAGNGVCLTTNSETFTKIVTKLLHYNKHQIRNIF